MKTIGLIGGMSWESTVEYYRIINEKVRDRLGRHHSARIVMYSVDFEDIEKRQREGRWAETAYLLEEAARVLERGGADFFLICTNTMHKVAGDVERSVNIPMLHIADATARKISEEKISSVGLLGTKFTMEEDFYKDRLSRGHGLRVIVPDAETQQIVHDIIYGELCQGRILGSSRKKVLEIIEGLLLEGAEGVILGCTEIPLLVSQKDSPVPLFDTASIHARAAVDLALEDG